MDYSYEDNLIKKEDVIVAADRVPWKKTDA